MYESDEKPGLFNNNQPEPNFHVGISKTNAKNVGILDGEKNNCFE